MIGGDEDDVIEQGAEGEGAEGQDSTAGQQEGELSTEQPDVETDDGQQEVDTSEPQKGSKEYNFRALREEARQAREDAAAARREAEEIRRQTTQSQTQQTEQQQREMLALMTPEERAEWRIQQFERRQAQERTQDRFQLQSLMDKNAFDAKATVNPVYAKHRETVEQMFQEQLRQGRPVEREILLQLHLGKLALAGAKSPKAKQAARRVEDQRVAPSGGKGDAAADRGKAGDTPGKRLEGVYI